MGYWIMGFMAIVFLVVFVPGMYVLYLSEVADERRAKGVPIEWQE